MFEIWSKFNIFANISSKIHFFFSRTRNSKNFVVGILQQMRAFNPANFPRAHRDWLCSTYFNPNLSGQYLVSLERVRNAHPIVCPIFTWCAQVLKPPGVKLAELPNPTIRDTNVARTAAPSRPREPDRQAKPKSPRTSKLYPDLNKLPEKSYPSLDKPHEIGSSVRQKVTPPPLPPLPSSLPNVAEKILKENLKFSFRAKIVANFKFIFSCKNVFFLTKILILY